MVEPSGARRATLLNEVSKQCICVICFSFLLFFLATLITAKGMEDARDKWAPAPEHSNLHCRH